MPLVHLCGLEAKILFLLTKCCQFKPPCGKFVLRIENFYTGDPDVITNMATQYIHNVDVKGNII